MIPCLSVGTGGTRCISVRWEKVNHKQVAGNTIDRLPVVEVFFLEDIGNTVGLYGFFINVLSSCVIDALIQQSL